MKVLITGAAGFSASHLIKRLSVEKAVQIYGVDLADRPPPSFSDGTYYCADLSDSRQVLRVVESAQPEYIFHLAGLAHGARPDLYRANFTATLNLLDAVCTALPDARILVVGSAAEYGLCLPDEMPITEQCHCRPVEAYGISKLAMSLAALDYARTCEMKIIVVRPFNLIGAGLPASLLVGAILQRAKQALSANHDPTISVGNLDSARDFIAIEDAVDAYVRLMKAEAWGEVFNVCSGQARSVRCVIETLLSFAPRPIRAVTDPALMRAVDAPVVVGSCEKARRTCGFQPAVNLDDALRSAWNHVMRQ